MNTDHGLGASYRHEVEIALRHTDAAGIVFFPRYLEMMQDAFEAFLETRGLGAARIMRETHYYLPVVHAECDYRAPLFWGDRITIEVGVAEARRRSFAIAYRFVDATGRAVARGRTAHAVADKATRRAIALPAELRRALGLAEARTPSD